MREDELTKVHVDLPNHWATSGEAMWARSLGSHRFRIDNVPFYAYGLNYGDIVEAIPEAPDLKPSVLRVLERSGHQTLRVFFEEAVEESERLRLLDSLKELGVTYERCSPRYFALDLEPGSSLDRVRRDLDEWQARGLGDYETCEPRQPDSFDDRPTDDSPPE
jgi:hypothetical protein